MRKQRAFASLTEEEIDQIAGWLRHDNYDHVRERIALPRPEGFGLTISNKPLQILFGRKNTVAKINRKLESGQKLTLSEFESIAAGEKADLPEKIHNAILETIYDRVLEDDNTPNQLLSLQRLADFPARADYRDHKIQMDLHRKEMAEHRKYIADERLALAKRALDLRENAPLQRPDSRNSNNLFRDPKTGRLCDDLGPIPKTPEDIRARAIKFYGFDAEELARKAQERARAQATAPPPPDLSAPINTNIHAGDSEKTEITGVSTPSETSREPQPPHETPDSKCQMENARCSTLNEKPTPHAANTSEETPKRTESLESRVNKYTLARYHEALHGKDSTRVGRTAAYNFRSAMQHCPCGKHVPCPDHGDFPRRFFEILPDDADYIYWLEKKKLPFVPIHELLARQRSESDLRAKFTTSDVPDFNANEPEKLSCP